MDHLLKTKKDYKNLKKQEIHNIYQRGLERLMEILNIYLEEQLLLKYYVIKHLIFQKVQSMMDIKEVLLQLFTNILIKNLLVLILMLYAQINLQVMVLKMKICQNSN